MSIVVESPGLQTTIQARPRFSLRHLGVPASGPADPLSMALANRLVGNSALTPALETTLTGVTLRFKSDTQVGVAGAEARCTLNDVEIPQHRTIDVVRGDVLAVGAAKSGVRCYVAFAGGLIAEEVLGSASTYMTAELGGFAGRALREGDRLDTQAGPGSSAVIETPAPYRLPMLSAWSMRAGLSCESSVMPQPGGLFDGRFTVAGRSDRMGIKLDGFRIDAASDAQMPSVPVFPGTIQCPQDGSPYILAVDSGTTGGYPRIAKITRMDLHILGQLRPGNTLRLIARDDDQASLELREKHAYWREWLPDIATVV